MRRVSSPSGSSHSKSSSPGVWANLNFVPVRGPLESDRLFHPVAHRTFLVGYETQGGVSVDEVRENCIRCSLNDADMIA